MFTNVKLNTKDVDIVRDILCEAFKVDSLTDKEVNDHWGELPETIKYKAVKWGLNDMMVKKEITKYIEGNS